MPELPEVETIRSDISDLVLGRRILAVDTSSSRVFRDDPSQGLLMASLVGGYLSAAMRWGKFLILLISPDPEFHPVQGCGRELVSSSSHPPDRFQFLVVHLGMSGQISRIDELEVAPAHTHMNVLFSGGVRLGFSDPRTFGRILISSGPGRGPLKELEHIGVDPILDTPSVNSGVESIRSSSSPIKSQLLDQTKIAGIGNMYADEILIRAGIHPRTPGSSVSDGRAQRLVEAMVKTLKEAISERGSSLADLRYRDLYGIVGRYQFRHLAYARTGQPCLICGNLIVRERFQNRYSHFCPSCQVLDRRC